MNITIAVPMARKRKWVEDTVARFAEGTFARIATVLGKTEDRTDFIREAVEREIVRREAEAAKQKKRKP
jgi:hypothetical protein